MGLAGLTAVFGWRGGHRGGRAEQTHGQRLVRFFPSRMTAQAFAVEWPVSDRIVASPFSARRLLRGRRRRSVVFDRMVDSRCYTIKRYV